MGNVACCAADPSLTSQRRQLPLQQQQQLQQQRGDDAPDDASAQECDSSTMAGGLAEWRATHLAQVTYADELCCVAVPSIIFAADLSVHG
eukprot:SAG25_NODE_450_length_7893_cov_72.130613_2_plen_90_part_00